MDEENQPDTFALAENPSRFLPYNMQCCAEILGRQKITPRIPELRSKVINCSWLFSLLGDPRVSRHEAGLRSY